MKILSIIAVLMLTGIGHACPPNAMQQAPQAYAQAQGVRYMVVPQAQFAPVAPRVVPMARFAAPTYAAPTFAATISVRARQPYPGRPRLNAAHATGVGAGVRATAGFQAGVRSAGACAN